MEQMLHWILDFTGVKNGDNPFSTHMYNFWLGFGGNVSILALAGALIGVYSHYNKYLHTINPVAFAKKPLELLQHKKDKSS